MQTNQAFDNVDPLLRQLEEQNRIQSVFTTPIIEYSELNVNTKKEKPSTIQSIFSNKLFILTPETTDYSSKWDTFRELCRHEKAMQIAIEKKDVKEEISQIIGLAEVFREHGLNGEAYQELMCAITSAERLSLAQYDAQLEFMHARGLFLLSAVLKDVKKVKDSEEYLEAAKERAESLVKSIAPTNQELNTQISLAYSAKLILCEILLYKTKQFLEGSNAKDTKECSNTICNLVVPALSQMLLVGQSDPTHSVPRVTILNSIVFRELLLQSARCFHNIASNDIAKRLLRLGEMTYKDEVDTSLLETNKLKSFLQEIETQEKSTEKKVVVSPPKFIPSKFVDDDFDDGWPDSDEEDTKKKTVDKFKEDDESSGWGSEPDDEPSPKRASTNFFKDIFANAEEDEARNDPIQTELFPLEYRFFKSRPTDDAMEQASQKPPKMYSLKMNENEERSGFEGKKEMRLFLQTIISKHDLYASSPKAKEGSEESVIENFHQDLNYTDKYSLHWAQKYYETSWKLYYLGTREAHMKCSKLMIDYFAQLPSAKITTNVDQEDAQKLIGLYNISISLLEIAALLWTPEDTTIFKNMSNSINKFYPKHTDPIILVEMKAMCHHIRSLLYSEIWEEHRQIAPTLLRIYQTHNKAAGKVGTAERIHNKNHIFMMPTSQEIACQALLILHHYLCNLSPLTLSTLFPYNPNTEYFDDSTGAQSTLEQTEFHDEVYPDFDEEFQQHPLFDIHHRVELLNVLYHKLPCLSVLKAVTALALGQYSRIVSKDKVQAESVLFESIFIFDKTTSIIESIPTIMCDAGTKSLIEFALILTENNKYPYASLAYRAAVDNNRLVHLEHDVELISELAVLSSKNDDWKSAVYYYQELLDRAYGEGNVPKVVYLSEKLSEEYVERGDFRNAEQYITRATNFVKSASGKTGDFELTLQLKLAHLFLQGYYFERGIDFLAKLMEEKLTPIQKCLVFTNLAEAYLKKRWLRECDFVLNKLGPLLEHNIIREANGVDEIKVLDIAARCYYRTGNYSYALYSVNIAINRCSTPSRLAQLFFLKGKIFQALSKSSTPINFPTGLHVDSVQKHPIFSQFLDPTLFAERQSTPFLQYQEFLQSIPPSPSNGATTTSMQQNGYFISQSPVPHTPSPSFTSNFLGKTGKSALSPSPPPTSEPPPLQQLHRALTLNDIIYNKRCVYNNPGELLQDCLSCYEKSLYYYNAVSDEISLAKVRLRMARSQLDYLFVPVTMLHIDPDNIVQLPPPVDLTKADSNIIDVKLIDETYITPAMDTAVRTTHVLLSIDAYITRAEARYLEGRKTAAQAFWTECRDVFFTLIINDGEVVVARGGPPGFLERLLLILGRLVRLLFCFDIHFINKNLAVIDTYLSLEIEIDQVLKRSGENVEAKELYTYDSGNDSPSESDNDLPFQDNPLISQNRIYEAMPYNSSMGKGKSLPFLRRNRKTSSLSRSSSGRRKGLGRVGLVSGTGSQGSSTSGSTKSISTDNGLIDGVGMTVRVTERVWSCFFRMKQHSRKYSQQSMDESDLCYRNQQSMRRLYALMSALRSQNAQNSESNAPSSVGHSTGNNLVVGNNPNEKNVPTNPTSTIHHNSSTSRRPHQDINLINFDTASTTTTTDQEEKEFEELENNRTSPRKSGDLEKQTHDLQAGDLVLVNCMLRKVGNSDTASDDILTTSTLDNVPTIELTSEKGNSHNSPSNKNSLNDNRAHLIHILRHRRQDSLPSDTSVLEAFTTTLDSKITSRLVYILQIDDVIVYYIPKPGKKEFHRFGGRRTIHYKPSKRDSANVGNSPTVQSHNRTSLGSTSLDKSMSDSNLNALTGFLHLRGISTSTSNDNISSMSTSRQAKQPIVSSVRERNDWLLSDFETFVHALLLQGRRERRSHGGLENTEEIINLLRTSMFKGPWTYKPPHKQRTSSSTTAPTHSIDYKSLYGGVIGGGGSTNTLTTSKRKKPLLQGTKFSFWGARDPATMLPALNDLHIPDRPLICICSKHLQVVPWELMFDDFTTRAFTLRDVMKKKQRTHKERYMPTYFCFYSEDEQKFIGPVERQRREWIFQEFRRNAALAAEDAAILFHDMLPNLPLHTPLIQYGKKPKVYKSRYKHVNFIKLSQIADKPTQIITHIESYLTAPQYPVFIFTLADLMDLSEAILCILSYRPDCTLLFIAEGAMIAAVEMLMDMQNMYIRNGQLAGNCSARQGYQFLAHCIHVLRKQLNVPLVVINPPHH